MVAIAPARIGAVPGYDTLSARKGPTSYELIVEPQRHSTCCIYCAALGIVKDGRKWMGFSHIPIGSKSCTIRVHRQRYRCLVCDRTHSDPLPGLDPRRRVSIDAVSYVRENVNRSYTDLAKGLGVAPNTVQHLIDDFAAEIRMNRLSTLPVILGMDEIYLKRKPHCVFTDILNHLHFNLLADDSADTIKAALREYPDRDSVQVVVIDLKESYRDIARDLLPNAVVAIDLFHILRLADERREEVRVQAAQGSSGDTRTLLRGRKNFWERFDKPDGWQGAQAILFGPMLPSLALAHETYTKLCLIFHTSKSSRECTLRFDDWVKTMPSEMLTYFQSFIDTADNFREEIFRYVDLGLTNGFTEGNNRSIRNQFSVAPRSSYENFHKLLMARAERKCRITDTHEIVNVSAQDASEHGLSIAASVDRSRKMSARRNRF